MQLFFSPLTDFSAKKKYQGGRSGQTIQIEADHTPNYTI